MRLKVPKRIGLFRLSLLALVVGLVSGIGAVVFRGLIAFIHNLAFVGSFSTHYDASVFTPSSPWGVFVVLVPVIGGLLVTFLITKFAPEARGHGVPEVMDAIYYKDGVIRPVVAVIKSLASAISIGTGGAIGREGPIIQIGAALGSTLGQIIHMAPWQRITLVAAGAGAGIAATFNTPIGGVMFAIELMMPELSARTFLPVALATGAATFVGRIFFGVYPAFVVPATLLTSTHQATLMALLLFALLGALTGLAATAFVRGLSLAEDLFERIEDPYLRHTVGMLGLGVLLYGFLVLSGHYYVEGVGYATIQAVLTGNLTLPGLLLLLSLAKLCATLMSLGSGASGGFLTVIVHGSVYWRSVRRDRQRRPSGGWSRRDDGRDCRHGRDGRRWHRSGNDCRDHDFRDDAGLRSGDAEHYRRGARDWRQAASVAGEYLHDQAGRSRSQDTEGHARQPILDPIGARGDGARYYRRVGRHGLR